MIDKPLDQVDRADLEALVVNKKKEDRTTEYKEILYGKGDSERKEFLADIVSLSFTGGDLILGVEEERDADGKSTGVPRAVHGVAVANESQEILSLEQSLSTGIAPRIIGVRVQVIPGFNRGPVIVFRVPQSLNAPHMVTLGGTSRFYGRNSAGKYRLDVGEIRAAFLASDAIPRRIRDFRAERINLIRANEGPVRLTDSAMVVLHLVPFSAFTPASNIDLSQLSSISTLPLVSVLQGGIGFRDYRINLDGFLNMDLDSANGGAFAYVQAFTTGVVEAVSAVRSLSPVAQHNQVIENPYFEEGMIDGLTRFLKLADELEIEPPFAVMVTLLGVKGYMVRHPIAAGPPLRRPQPIDRDLLILDESIITEYGDKPAAILRSSLDAIWRASGLPRSPYYDANGERTPAPR